METLYKQPLDAEEIQWQATAENWKEFLRAPVWRDLRQYIEISMNDAKELLSIDLEERAIKESDDKLRGGLKMLKALLAFPTEQMEELENDRGRDDSSGSDIG